MTFGSSLFLPQGPRVNILQPNRTFSFSVPLWWFLNYIGHFGSSEARKILEEVTSFQVFDLNRLLFDKILLRLSLALGYWGVEGGGSCGLFFWPSGSLMALGFDNVASDERDFQNSGLVALNFIRLKFFIIWVLGWGKWGWEVENVALGF